MKRNFMDASLGVDLNFVRNQSHVLNTRAYEVEYPEMDFAALVPVNASYPEWADGVDSFIHDKVGAAKWQSGYAKDIPLADITLEMVSSNMAMYAVGYRWNIEELGKAQFQNFPLTARKASAARFASEVFQWETALFGAGHPGWYGLLNSPYATVLSSAATGTVAPTTSFVNAAGQLNKSPMQVITELNRLITGPSTNTGVLMSILSDPMLFPEAVLRAMENTPFGESSPNTSVLEYFKRNNIYTLRTGQQLTIRELPLLATAATTVIAGGGRIVAYRNSQDMLELPMPMPYRFLPVHQDGPLQYIVPGIGRIGQLQVFRTNMLRYLDGVSPVPTP